MVFLIAICRQLGDKWQSNGRQMAIENYVSNDFLSTFLDSNNVFDCHLPDVLVTLLYVNFKTSWPITKWFKYM